MPLAALTLDFEWDYGGRLGSVADTLKQRDAILDFRQQIQQRNVPLSAFVQTEVALSVPRAVEALKLLADDFHSHSHSHARTEEGRESDLIRSREILSQVFQVERPGFRAPYGRLFPGDIELLKKLDFAFDASLFPSYRPGVFQNLRAPTEPFLHPNGLPELPFGVLRGVRMILGISWIKLIGWNAFSQLLRRFSPPQTAIVYFHLHDLFPPDNSASLPLFPRLAFSRNKLQGQQITFLLIEELKQRGYEFVTMSELAKRSFSD